jgi:exopolysaccharide biosynthesis polyprenyl glycosylphosphotransferase
VNPQTGFSPDELVVGGAEVGTGAIQLPQQGVVVPAPTSGDPLLSPPTSAIRIRRLRRDSTYRRSLAIADALAAAAAIVVSLPVAGAPGAGLILLVTVPLIVLINKLAGSYEREETLVRKTTLDEAPSLFQLATLYSLIVWLTHGFIVSGHRRLSELLIMWIGLFLFLLVFRTGARFLAARLTPPERCLLVGDEAACGRMEAKVMRRSVADVAVVDWIDPTRLKAQEIVSRTDIDRVIVTPGRTDERSVVDLVCECKTSGLKVSVVPRVLEAVGSSVELDDLEGMTLLSAGPAGFPRSSRLVKRLVDIVGAVLLLLVLMPLLALIAIAIRLDSPGGILFRQRRVGCDGQLFQMLKFRTMAGNAEEQKEHLNHLNEANGLFKIAKDPRITRVGRILRRASLDELPQLVNVLRGDMSLVGPRPLIADEDRRIEGWHRRRLHLTPGMTGHWQILGSARIPLEDMVRIDYLYVTNWSLWLDIKILLRTIPYVFARRGL